MDTKPLTILTERPSGLISRTGFFFRNLFRRIRHRSAIRRPLFKSRSYSGHFGVTRSVVDGLKRLGAPYRLNPMQIAGDVIVLSNVEALHAAIMAKRAGRIRKLLAGPNIMVSSRDHGGVLSSPEIDLVIVPSQWVKIAYVEDAPALDGRISIWPAGVDEHYWAPGVASGDRKHRTVLVYQKNASEELLKGVINTIEACGWRVSVIVYGKYAAENYRQQLANATFAVFLSRSESQGLALAEAWSMDVPTLVWDSQENEICGRRYSVISTAPYLTDACGALWRTVEDLSQLLDRLSHRIDHCHPRDWLLLNMTDEVCARHLLYLRGTITSA